MKKLNKKTPDNYTLRQLLGNKYFRKFEDIQYDPTFLAEMWKVYKFNMIKFRAWLIRDIKEIERMISEEEED